MSQSNEDGVLAGQLPGIQLSSKGIKQSHLLAKELSQLHIDRIITSPLLRCIETISPYAETVRKRVNKDAAFIEMDYGNWSGEKLSHLAKTKDWKVIQNNPGAFKFPAGESFIHAQSRVVRRLNFLAREYPNKTLLIVSHGDIIKLAIAATLNLQLSDFQRIVIDPASLSAVNWHRKNRTALSLNIKLVKSKGKTSSVNSRNLSQRRVLGGGKGE